MVGLILNLDEDRLSADSPWRTRDEERHQPPVFVLEDGFPVYEVWYWWMDRWWCCTRSYSVQLAEAGVIQFFGIDQLKAWVAHLQSEQKLAS